MNCTLTSRIALTLFAVIVSLSQAQQIPADTLRDQNTTYYVVHNYQGHTYIKSPERAGKLLNLLPNNAVAYGVESKEYPLAISVEFEIRDPRDIIMSVQGTNGLQKVSNKTQVWAITEAARQFREWQKRNSSVATQSLKVIFERIDSALTKAKTK